MRVIVDSLTMAWVEISEMLDVPCVFRMNSTRQVGMSVPIRFSAVSIFCV
nr:hypothetical protein [Azospirillum sp. INR13]